MPRYFWLREDKAATSRFSGTFNASHRWGLPGVMCPTCGATWGEAGHDYPGVDLSQLPERRAFETARAEPFPEFARLRELVRPLAPPNAELPPGTHFGPLVGTAQGSFGPWNWLGSSQVLIRRDALERLQAEGVRGLLGCGTALRFRKKDPPELMEPQMEPRGRLHPDCLPPDLSPPCVTCGRLGFARPDAPILDVASLPLDVDLFRVGNFSTMIIGTERLMEAVHRLEIEGVSFRELPVR